MAFWGCARGHRIDSETRCCRTAPGCLMSAWILSLEPEHHRTDGSPPRHETWRITEFVRRSSCFRLQLFRIETFLLLPQCQSDGRDLAC